MTRRLWRGRHARPHQPPPRLRRSAGALRAKAEGRAYFLIAVLCAGLPAWTLVSGAQAQTNESGKALYLKYCSQCHGEKGDGEGYAASHLRPRPRNFTTGKFKIRTTPNGALPTHDDLVNLIRRGMPYTSMPAWLFSEYTGKKPRSARLRSRGEGRACCSIR